MFSAKKNKDKIVVSFGLVDTVGFVIEGATTVDQLLTAIAWNVLVSKDPKWKREDFKFAYVSYSEIISVEFHLAEDPPGQA